MDGDGRAALSCCPVDVDVAGRMFRIAARPAIDWIARIAGEDWLGIVPGMIGGDVIMDLVVSGAVTSKDLVDAARDVVTTVSGMQWWVACRLAKAVVGNIEIVGAMILAGVNADTISIGGYLAGVYRLLVENRDEKQRKSFDAELSAVPAGVEIASDDTEYDPQVAGDQFERFYQRYGG